MTTWLLMRSTGLLALLLLTTALVLGVLATAPRRPGSWPRSLTQGVHRDAALLGVGLVAVHVATAVADAHAAVDALDVVVPFGTSYRPVWLGLGTVAVDLLLAVLVTTVLRGRLGRRAWRAVHLLGYALWPLAVLHGLGSGTDVQHPAVLGLTASCATAVLLVVSWRTWVATAETGAAP